MKRLLLAACITLAVPVAASAQDNAQVDPNRRAYGYALRCAATAAGRYTDPQATPAQKAAADASYQRAFDAAARMGRILRLSGEQIERDMASTVRTEAAIQLRNAAYYQQAQAECARLGM
jgi:hypothetical protein